jgi:hypothetical protein
MKLEKESKSTSRKEDKTPGKQQSGSLSELHGRRLQEAAGLEKDYHGGRTPVST